MKKLLAIATAGTALVLTGCDLDPAVDDVPRYECDVTQDALEQYPQTPLDWNTDGMLVVCVPTALVVPADPALVPVSTVYGP